MPETETQLRKRLNALRVARIQFRECLALPLKQAMLKRSPLASAQLVWAIPMEAAAAGFALTMLQDETGWHVTLSRAIDGDALIETAGDASSLLKALFQVVDFTEQRIAGLEAETRHQLAQTELMAQVAA